MLVLSRKPRQRIRIGADVWVEVLEVKGGQVRLGISAPREVLVRRAELAKNAAAAPPVEAPHG